MIKTKYFFKNGAENIGISLIITEHHRSGKRFAISLPCLSKGEKNKRGLGNILIVITDEKISNKKIDRAINKYCKKVEIINIEKIENFEGVKKLNRVHNLSFSYVKNTIKKYKNGENNWNGKKHLKKIIKLYEELKNREEINENRICALIREKIKNKNDGKYPFFMHNSISSGRTIPIFVDKMRINNFDLDNFNSFGCVKLCKNN